MASPNTYDTLRTKLFLGKVVKVLKQTDAYKDSTKAQAMIQAVEENPALLKRNGGLKKWTEEFVLPEVDARTGKAPAVPVMSGVCLGFGLQMQKISEEHTQAMQGAIDLFADIYKEEEPERYAELTKIGMQGATK